jgi:cytidine deaminase
MPTWDRTVWDFKGVSLAGGEPELVELSEQQRSRVVRYHQMLLRAVGTDVSRPPFSGYNVRASIGGSGKPPVPAGNREYGICKAIHGEESAVAAFRSVYGNGHEKEPVLAFVAHRAGDVPACCGNCRDILRDEFGPELTIVVGHPDGGIATVSTLAQFLVDDYTQAQVPMRMLADATHKTWFAGNELVNDAFSPEGHDLRKYVALVHTSLARYYGGRHVVCDYHPIYAIEDALRAAERQFDTFLREVLIVCEGDGSHPPDVMYRDRQHLHDFNLQAELVTGREQDPVVYLATVDSNRVTGLWQTTVKLWLPNPFNPRKFADMVRLEAYYKKRFPR